MSFYYSAPIAGIGNPNYMTIPQGALSPWQNALANVKAGIGAAIMHFPGASSAQGGSALTNIITQSTCGQFRNDLLNVRGYMLGGDIFISNWCAQPNAAGGITVGAWSANACPNGWPFQLQTQADGWESSGPYGFIPFWNGVGVSLATPQFAYIHPSVDLGYNARSIRVYLWDGGPQDGGASLAGQTCTLNTAAQDAGATLFTHTGVNRIRFVDFNNLPNTPGNSVFMGNQSNAKSLKVIAVLSCPTTVINTTLGLFTVRLANVAQCMGDTMNEAGVYPSDRISRWCGPTVNAAPFLPDVTLQPLSFANFVVYELYDDAAIMAPGTITQGGQAPSPKVNLTAVPPEMYGYGLEQMALAYATNPAGCTQMHELIALPNNRTSDSLIPAGFVPQNWPPYALQHIAVATMHDHIISDTYASWLGRGTTFGYLTANNPHPNPAGAGFALPLGNPPSYLNIQARGTRWKGAGL